MAMDLTWFKVTALSAVQHAAAVAITAFSADAANIWDVDWHRVAGLSGGTAVVSILAAILAYSLPGTRATAAVSAPTAAIQTAQAVIQARPLVGDAPEARAA